MCHRSLSTPTHLDDHVALVAEQLLRLVRRIHARAVALVARRCSAAATALAGAAVWEDGPQARRRPPLAFQELHLAGAQRAPFLIAHKRLLLLLLRLLLRCGLLLRLLRRRQPLW